MEIAPKPKIGLYLWPIWGLLLFLLCSLWLGWESPHPIESSKHLPPFSRDSDSGHFFLLGTDLFGRDMLSLVCFNGRRSFLLALWTTGLMGFIGMCVGGLISSSQNRRQKIGLFSVLSVIFGLIPATFYSLWLRKFILLEATQSSVLQGVLQIFISLTLFVIIIFLCRQLGKRLDKWVKWEWEVNLEELWLWLLQIVDSLPLMVVILTVMVIFQERSLFLVMSLIALVSWLQIALLTRAQILRERELPYMEANTMLGYSRFYSFWRHMVPNILPPIIGILALTISRVIITESALDFLGLISEYEGLGRMLSTARNYWQYLWLGIVPGIVLSIIIVLVDLSGERLRQFWEKK